MKEVTKALWHGIKVVFTAIVNWFATLFGMKDGSKYGLILRRITGTAFAAVVILWSATTLFSFTRSSFLYIKNLFEISDDEDFYSEELSDDVSYYESYYGEPGFLRNGKGRKILKDIVWIAKPLGEDSLVCYCDGELRGYFHMQDGRIVVKPTYRHAWVFSDGLAAVEEDGKVKFIDNSGATVIDRGFAYNESCPGYVFHNGLCAVHDSTGEHMGLIDREGNWVLTPDYSEIISENTLWQVTLDDKQGIFTSDLDTIIPLTQAVLIIYDDYIEAIYPNHTISTFTLDGMLIAERQIRFVNQLMYETHEVVYRDNGSDEDYYNSGTYVRRAVATCMIYEAAPEWYGLLGADGRPVTPPSYVNIRAIGKDLYLCETSTGNGIVLNSNGKRIE